MQRAQRRLISIVDHVLDSMQDVPSSLDWADAFKGGLSPTSPAENVALSLKSGELPADLAGVYMRVGPNSQYWPPKKRMHAFDGDGMVHSVRITNGTATYHCSYLETPRYRFEREWGEEWFTRIGEFNGKIGLAKAVALSGAKLRLAGLQDWEDSLANTAISFTPDGKLWATHQSGPPFRFYLNESGTPKSIGFDTHADTHRKPISAHPKFDYRTGEILFHGQEMGKKTFYFGRGVNGKVTDTAELDMPAGFHHDICVTEKYAVIIDGSMRFTPKAMASGKPLWMFKPKHKLRFGVFPRSCQEVTAENFIWIEAPVAAEVVHTMHAWDEDGKIILWTPMSYYKPGMEEGILGDTGRAQMQRVVIDIDKRSVEIHDVPGGANVFTDFPRVRDDGIGRDVRYGFSGVMLEGGDPEFNFVGVAKWDMKAGRLDSVFNFPEGVVGGEPVFMPRHGGANSDDDGYIGMFLWNPEAEESTFTIWDARTFSPTPVCELLVPRRVPIGFHAAFITEEQFQTQLQVLETL